MTVVSTDAPGARARSAADRLVEVRARLQRLESGEPTTAEDVRRARLHAQTQARAVEQARRRLVLTHRAASARQLERRQAMEAAPARFSAHGDELARLRSGLTSLMVWHAAETTGDPDLRHVWAGRIVEQFGAGAGRDWTEAACLAASSHLPRVRGAAITVRTGSEVDFTSASDPWAMRAQDLEHVLGEGPSTTARLEDRSVLVDDLGSAGHAWPGYAVAASELGVTGIHVHPLRVRGTCVGTLTLFGEGGDGGWRGACSAEVAVLAEVAAAALIADVEAVRLGQHERSQRLHIAVGLVSAERGISLEEASSRLRAHAFGTGRTMAEAADEVLRNAPGA